MSRQSIHSTNREFAEYFLEKVDHEMLIPELFNFFSFGFPSRSNVDPSELNDLLQRFEASKCSDIDVLTSIIDLLRRGRRALKDQDPAFWEQLYEYFDLNPTDEFSLVQLSEDKNISYYHLIHYFKQAKGCSPIQWRNRKRVELAIRMLVQTDANISDIALNCGFGSLSYFGKFFLKTTGKTPSVFRADHAGMPVFEYYRLEDLLFSAKMNHLCFLAKPQISVRQNCVSTTILSELECGFEYLHEPAVTEYRDTLHASWYVGPIKDLGKDMPVCGVCSFDGGKSWTKQRILETSETDQCRYCATNYGTSDGTLYMFKNVLSGPDCPCAISLYALNNQTGQFELLWNRPIPFLAKSNVVKLPNGKLLISGRTGPANRLANIPAVLISDSGKIDGDWRIVRVAECNDLPNDTMFMQPELSVICCNDVLYGFCRNDMCRVPLVYLSYDYGETWTEAMTHDIPFARSKILGGTLSDGRNYLIGNAERYAHKFDRSKLCLYISKPGTMEFDRKLVLYDTETVPIEGTYACHYPSAVEYDGKLHVVATLDNKVNHTRNAVLFTVDLSQI